MLLQNSKPLNYAKCFRNLSIVSIGNRCTTCQRDRPADAAQLDTGDDSLFRRRRWWSGILARRLRRNRVGQLHVHVRFGRRTTENPEAGNSGKFKQFLRFGR